MYKVTLERLLIDSFYAFQCAKKHKSSKSYVIEFEKHLDENLCSLANEIYERRYKPMPSICFIINDPKKREIFAANFRDRIVHHLYYNYVHEMYERTFIEDSYSCRIGKGTHYGIHRLEKHIRQESENYAKETYVLKMDIKGYFMHINRPLLLEMVNDILDAMKDRIVDKSKGDERYGDVLDFELIKYLSKEIILLNPIEECILRSKKSDWLDLPKSKSLFYSNEGCGLPIGNLTSQLFSNVYLNKLDQFVKRELKCKHYGRYVDDFYLVSTDKEYLKNCVDKIKSFLKERLLLDVQDKKTAIVNVKNGVNFLGAFIQPYRVYVSNGTLKRIRRHLYNFRKNKSERDVINMVNSYLGIFSHYCSNLIKKNTMDKTKRIYNYGKFIGFYEKFVTVN